MDTKVFLMKLIISCPLQNAHADCPFIDLRNAPITQLIELTNQISETKIERMLSDHEQCMKERKKTLKAG